MSRAITWLIAAALLAVPLAAPGASNVYAGPCSGLLAYETSTGVTDDEGTQHPGSSGWTTPHFKSTHLVSIPTVSSDSHCSSVRVSVRFTADPKYRILTMDPQPSACDCAKCNLELDDWVKQITRHEERHVDDYRKIASQTGWRGRLFTACGASPLRMSILRRKVQAALDQTLADLNAKADAATAAFHATSASAVTPPSCDECKSCETGQAPRNCSLPGLCPAGTCAQPASLCCSGTCCGLSPAQQPVACCLVGGKATCSPFGTSKCP